MDERKKLSDLVLASQNLSNQLKSEIVECLTFDVDQSLKISRFEQNRDEAFDFYSSIEHVDKLMNKDSVTGLKELVKALSESSEERLVIYNVSLLKGSYSFFMNVNETDLIGYFESLNPGYR